MTKRRNGEREKGRKGEREKRRFLILPVPDSPIHNKEGYALVVMVFIMAAFLSVIFLLCCPIIKEAREDADFYIIDRNDYRYRKAMFGETVDQCGTKLVHCGGYFSDYHWSGQFGKKWQGHTHYVIARIFGVAGNNAKIMIPEDYIYNDGFWSRYRGKRYLHILPSDKWDYTTYYGTVGQPYKPYNQPYARIGIGTGCGHGGGGLGYDNSAKGSHFIFGAYGELYVEVKDYSRERMENELRLMIAGVAVWTSAPDTSHSDYDFYTFYAEFTIRSRLLAKITGQKKLMIQVRKKNSDEPWITMDTKPIILPVNAGGGGRLIYRVNFYD